MEWKYDAFISYRHCEPDSFVAEKLQKMLEEFKISGSLAKKLGLGRRGLERVFRDEAELPLSDNLSDSITAALESSEFLIVICSPRLHESLWCRRELETFLKLRDRKHVLLVLAEGEPSESFPEVLTYEELLLPDENGNEVKVRVEREPLAADCRASDNKHRLKAMENAVLRLCAAIFHVNYDDLKQRHREQQFRKRMIRVSLVTVVALIFALTCLVFTVQIRRQNEIIRDRFAGSMAVVSEELLARGQRMNALYAARSVLPEHETQGYNAEAYKALVKALAPYETKEVYFPEQCLKSPVNISGFSLSPDGKLAEVYGVEFGFVLDTESGEELYRYPISVATVLTDDALILLDNDGSMKRRDIRSGAETWMAEGICNIFASPSGNRILADDSEGIRVWDGDEEIFSLKYSDLDMDVEEPFCNDASFSADGEHVAVSVASDFETWILQFSLTDGKPELSLEISAGDMPIFATDGDTLYYYSENEDPLNSGESGVLQAYEVPSGKLRAEKEVGGSDFYYMLTSDQGILLFSYRLAYMYDPDLVLVSSLGGYMDAVCTFPNEYGFGLLDGRGDLFFCEPGMDYRAEWMLYGHNSQQSVSNALYRDGKIYISFMDSKLLAVYSMREPAGSVGEEELEEFGELFDSAETMPETDGLEGIEDIDVLWAAASDDGKYIVVSAYDGANYVYNVSDGSKVRLFYDADFFLWDLSFPYLEEAQVYILNNRVFDKDFRMISEIPDGTIVAKGKDGRSVAFSSATEVDRYDLYTIIPYDEMIERVDELLGDYVPDTETLQKYNME
ncbi:MAG: toll/interleukin-1 receptor domain-containing protein [Lachnospiraceae bacterium]|nr:toll/interleukin-1 receptor domain-containing protein [Lachnospiraceae bacterium]